MEEEEKSNESLPLLSIVGQLTRVFIGFSLSLICVDHLELRAIARASDAVRVYHCASDEVRDVKGVHTPI